MYLYLKNSIKSGEACVSLELTGRKKARKSTKIVSVDGIILDFNVKSELIGIEILGASKRVPFLLKDLQKNHISVISNTLLELTSRPKPTKIKVSSSKAMIKETKKILAKLGKERISDEKDLKKITRKYSK